MPRAADYHDALSRLVSIVAELPALEGRSRGVVRASWDPELSAVMLAAGRAGHEELVLDELLNDLQET